MKIHLVVVQGRPEGMQIPIPIPHFFIGRDASCHLRPNSNLVSKQHCVILRRKDGVFVRDLNSSNGTYVNDNRIQDEVAVHDGDLLGVGPLVFAVKIEATAGGEKPPIRKDDEEAASWSLDYTAGSKKSEMDPSSETTRMQAPSPGAPESEETVSESNSNQARKSAGDASEIAGELLDKLLRPPKKKKK